MKAVMASFRITEVEAQAIKQRAERERVSASELLRQALAAYLNPPTPPRNKRATGRAQAAKRRSPDAAPVQL